MKSHCALILSLMLVAPTLADASLPVPEAYTVCSPSGIFCAHLDPQRALIRIYRAGQESDDLWTMEGWFRQAALGDDGETLVTGYDGLDLLPLDYRQDDLILRIYRRGVLVRAVALNEVIDDFSSLQRTESHYYWGHYLGFDEAGDYVIETVENRVITIDIATGEVAGRR